MAKKTSASASGTSTPGEPTAAAAVAPAAPPAVNSTSQNPLDILSSLHVRYVKDTPQRTKLIDAFLAFLVVVGVLQFVYCVVAGNYPFNAFLAGFSATVGQFVLTVGLRIQSNPENKGEFESVSPERAFADFVFGSVLLHIFCVNFIN